MEWLKKRAWPPYNRRRVSRSELGCDGLAGPGKAPAAAALLALAGRLIMHGQLTGAARPFPLLNRCSPLREKRVRVASAAGADALAACCCARLDTKLWR